MTLASSWVALLVMVTSLVAGCTLAEEPPPTSPTIRALHQTGSKDIEASREIIVNETAWLDWWSRNSGFVGNDGARSPAPPSGADFDKEFIVAVTSGQHSNSCINIRVTNATWQGSQLEITVTTYQGGANACLQVLTNVADVVAISPRAPVVFREATAPLT